jgi:hypothetical protein
LPPRLSDIRPSAKLRDLTETANVDIFRVAFFDYQRPGGRKIMLTFEKFSRRPKSFRRPTGVDIALSFSDMKKSRRKK